MSIDEHIAYAEIRRADVLVNGTINDVIYWNGYIDGLKAIKREQENERNFKND